MEVKTDTASKLFQKMIQAMPEISKQTLKKFGGEIIDENVKRIDARATYLGTAQQENSPAYKAIKRKTLGHDIPLWGKLGRLRKAGLYKIVVNSSRMATLSPPPDRRKVIEYLRQRDYVFWGIPNTVRNKRPSVRFGDILKQKMRAFVNKNKRSSGV